MTVYSNKIDNKCLNDLLELKRIRKGYKRTGPPWYFENVIGNLDVFAGFPVRIEQARIVKFSAKKIRSSELTPVELAASCIQIFVPLSDVGFCMVDAATLRYGSVYIAESDAKNSIQPHKMRNRDYYLLVINCAKT